MKKIIHNGKYLNVVEQDGWEYIERKNPAGAVVIVPALLIDGVKNLILIKEYRVPLQKINVSCPAGLIGDVVEGEDLQNAAHRELLEETGFVAGRLRYLTEGTPSSGITNELLTFYLADALVKITDTPTGDGTEKIEIVVVPVVDIVQWSRDMMAKGYSIDPKIFMAAYFVEKMEIENGTRG